MKRIFPAFAYSDAPRDGCWWDETCDIPDRAPIHGDQRCDVAIVGGGYTGISAALHLAEAGVSVAVLENRFVGWGASGRNGGFCCLGGAMLEDAALDRQFGRNGRLEWRATERDAVYLVEDIISRLELNVDRHSDGETQVAHRPKDFEKMRREVSAYAENYGVTPQLIEKKDLAQYGMNSEFHGAMTIPIGFGLNPQKYITGMAAAAEKAGTQIFHNSCVRQINKSGEGFELRSPRGRLFAKRVVIATNGYSSEDLPDWLSARYMPSQSSIIVTRPLTDNELNVQGWTSRQAAYDTRHLLHYFRLMPDNRMLFGVRGGLMANPASEARATHRARSDFERMFPAWHHVETPHAWSGMVCIARNRMPFVGKIPDQKGIFAGLCYHGNGVAMASYAGALLADLVQDRIPDRNYPKAVQRPLARFELGRFRRAVMPFAYAGLGFADR